MFNNQEQDYAQQEEFDEDLLDQDQGYKVENPVHKNDNSNILEQINQNNQYNQIQESEHDVDEEQIEHKPAFFSMRFQNELQKNADDEFNEMFENQENINQLNTGNVLINKLNNSSYGSDHQLNINTIQMKQLLGQEKLSPELLPYQKDLVDKICFLIKQQDKFIAQKQKKVSDNINAADERAFIRIYQMELERVKYTLKAYLRARILKIEANLFYIVEKDQAFLLSPGEADYAWNLFEARKSHMNTEFFSQIPKSLNLMQDGKDMPDQMITRPNSSKFVFVRFLISKVYHKFNRGLEKEIKEDCIYYIPFDEVKEFLEKGDAELV